MSVWKLLKECEIPEKELQYMEVGDYFFYTGNIDKTGFYQGKNKYIFRLEGMTTFSGTKEVHDIELSKFGDKNKTWTVSDDKRQFTNIQYFIKTHGFSKFKEIAVEKDYKLYMQARGNDLKEELSSICIETVTPYDLSTDYYSKPTVDIDYDNSKKDIYENTSIIYKYDNDETNKEETKMSEKMKEVIEVNADAAKMAAKIVAGNTLNTAVMEKVMPQLPMLVRGYAGTPLGNVVIANLVSFGVSNFMEGNDKAEWVADAMMVAAMTKALGSFNLEKILKDVIATAGVDIPTVTAE